MSDWWNDNGVRGDIDQLNDALNAADAEIERLRAEIERLRVLERAVGDPSKWTHPAEVGICEQPFTLADAIDLQAILDDANKEQQPPAVEVTPPELTMREIRDRAVHEMTAKINYRLNAALVSEIEAIARRVYHEEQQP